MAFTLNACEALIEFYCVSLNELANLSRSDLDSGVANLYKALSNIATACDRFQLKSSKILIFHAIRIHFLDRINCSAPLNTAEIVAVTTDNISAMLDNYSESTQTQDPSSSLEAMKIPKLNNKI